MSRVSAQHHCVKHRTINIIIDKAALVPVCGPRRIDGHRGGGVKEYTVHTADSEGETTWVFATLRNDCLDIYLCELARK